MARSQWEAKLERAMQTVIGACEGDPDPVSMITLFESRPEDARVSVVVLKSPEVIEAFREWAERNGIYRRDRDIDGKPREGE